MGWGNPPECLSLESGAFLHLLLQQEVGHGWAEAGFLCCPLLYSSWCGWSSQQLFSDGGQCGDVPSHSVPKWKTAASLQSLQPWTMFRRSQESQGAKSHYNRGWFGPSSLQLPPSHKSLVQIHELCGQHNTTGERIAWRCSSDFCVASCSASLAN